MDHRSLLFRSIILSALSALGCGENAASSYEDATGANGGATATGGAGGATATGGAGGATGSGGSAAGEGTGGGGAGCWELLPVTRVRVYPAPGGGQKMLGGKIAGSNVSAMNGFVDLVSIDAAPADSAWTELTVANAVPYRYIKYYSPAASYGAIAEIEFYSGDVRVDGVGFGTAGSRNDSGTTFDKALDGNTSTYFEGPLANDNYVGVDAVVAHMAATPTFTPAPGKYATAQNVTIATSTSAASVLYTTDNSDPSVAGSTYSTPITVDSGTVRLKAVARKQCMADSEIASGVFTIGEATPSVQSSIHIGNSLTDTIVGWLEPVADAGGITLTFDRYTIPGSGTRLYQDNPTGGFGVSNVQTAVKTNGYDHLSMQPFPNMPCKPIGDDSDSFYMNMAWNDAKQSNSQTQVWVYQQWPAPPDDSKAGNEWSNCISGGGWLRDPANWNPPAPATWDAAVENELDYMEVVRAELERLHPSEPKPYIVPAGLALLRVKQAMAAGQIPGMTSFFPTMFADNGIDLHVTAEGAYVVTLVFYTCMFQQSPVGLPSSFSAKPTSLTSAQASKLQEIVLETVSGYELSGWAR